ncbi:helix-turn-helix domain-containing protein [Chitinimonas sp. JJ19]|uniref:helix-turn-helix domain-containing protein n=1 Tax=Chitinimonas sp. JJ19 TaxID=3109352 RepID=UPI0030037C2E
MTASKREVPATPIVGSELALLVGKAIASRRKALGPGYSQEWLGEQVGLSKQTISRMENGRIAPTIFRLHDISSALQCTMGELLDGVVQAGSDHAQAVIRLIDGLPEAQREPVLRVVREVVASLKQV